MIKMTLALIFFYKVGFVRSLGYLTALFQLKTYSFTEITIIRFTVI
jgi:hypothetical protein